MPNKEETTIGEDGSLISVGEKQRIGIARALYLEREILICDEITSALDLKTTENIINCLKYISKEKTIISFHIIKKLSQQQQKRSHFKN